MTNPLRTTWCLHFISDFRTKRLTTVNNIYQRQVDNRLAPDLCHTYTPRVINTEQQLGEFLPKLRAAAWVAMDTEADSLHAYPEKVCLIQIGTAAGDELIDPLAPVNLDPLFAALSEHELIMHGADYDLRLFRKHHEFVPRAIFDTMLAARLLGERQFGLSSLVENFSV